MSRQPEGKNQGVDAFSVFRFPEKDGGSKKSSVRSSERSEGFSSASSGSSAKGASWASLAAGKKKWKSRSVASGSYVKTSFSSTSDKPVEKKAVKVIPVQEEPAGFESVPAGEKLVVDKAEVAQPESKVDAIDSAAIQKVLDEMYQKGLEQGHKEGRAEQLEAAIEEARQSGFIEGQQQGAKQGFQHGLERAEQELNSRYSALESLSDELVAQKQILSDRQSGLAARLLERLLLDILRVELRHSPERIEVVLRESLALLEADEQEVLRVYLHPDDISWVAGLADSEHLTLRLIEDSQLMRGGCRVEGALGDIDATLESRLSAGIDHIRSMLGDDEHEVQLDATAVVEEFSVSMRESAQSLMSSQVSEVRRSAPAATVEESVAIPSSFSFNPDSSSELGAWDSLGQ